MLADVAASEGVGSTRTCLDGAFGRRRSREECRQPDAPCSRKGEPVPMLSSTITAPNTRAQSTAHQPNPSAAAVERRDAERALIAAVRRGDRAVFAELYAEHVAAAYNLARKLSLTDADDLVAEAFTKVLATLLDDRGPHESFRAYLLTALRHVHYDRFKRAKRTVLTSDVAGVADTVGETVPFTDTAVINLEHSLASRAFASLTPRWQKVLWHTEIQQQEPAEVAPLLGLSANAVAQLACRARRGLRSAYLQMHVGEKAALGCEDVVPLLGAWTRDEGTKWEKRRVVEHLAGCSRCRGIAEELREDNAGLPC